MGLFDNLKKAVEDVGAAAKRVAQSEEAADLKRGFQSAMSDAGRRIREAEKPIHRNTTDEPRPIPAGAKVRVATASGATIHGYDTNGNPIMVPVETKLINVLAAEFPQYTVVKDVSPTTIGGVGRFMPYSLGVYDGDVPKLFIMIVGKNTTTHREYRWSREQAERAGVTMINFVAHYPNEIPYIVDRLHQYL